MSDYATDSCEACCERIGHTRQPCEELCEDAKRELAEDEEATMPDPKDYGREERCPMWNQEHGCAIALNQQPPIVTYTLGGSYEPPAEDTTDEAVEEALRQLRDHFMLPSVSQRSIDILEATITSLRSEVAVYEELVEASKDAALAHRRMDSAVESIDYDDARDLLRDAVVGIEAALTQALKEVE